MTAVFNYYALRSYLGPTWEAVKFKIELWQGFRSVASKVSIMWVENNIRGYLSTAIIPRVAFVHSHIYFKAWDNPQLKEEKDR